MYRVFSFMYMVFSVILLTTAFSDQFLLDLCSLILLHSSGYEWLTQLRDLRVNGERSKPLNLYTRIILKSNHLKMRVV